MSSPNDVNGPKGPSVIPGMVLLAVAAVLIVVLLVKPDMPGGLKTTLAVAAILVVLGLLAFAFKLFLASQKGSRR